MMKKIFFALLFTALSAILFSCSKTPVIRSTESDADKIYQEGLFYLEKGDLTNSLKKARSRQENSKFTTNTLPIS